MSLKKISRRIDFFLISTFIIGLLPASFIIHVIQGDFAGYYFLALSFLEKHEFAYQAITSICGNPLNAGLNARAPLVPLFIAASMSVFGTTLFGLYLPFFLARIFLMPLTYLVAKQYIDRRIAFLASSLLLFIPKLQTYAFGSPEADVYVALFYILALLFYFKSENFRNRWYSVFFGLSLGLGALSKSIGLAIGIGFFLTIFVNYLLLKPKKLYPKNFLLFISSILISIGPYLLWTIFVHHQLYLTTQHDKSLNYILVNLPSLFYTIPLYLGMNFSLGLKAFIVSCAFLALFLFGIARAIRQKHFELIFPSVVTLVLISLLSTCLIGANIPANYEFITILGFTMIPSIILFFLGVEGVLFFAKSIFRKINAPKYVFTLFSLLFVIAIYFKFVNNFFSAPYALNFIPSDYYITMKTVVTNREQTTDVVFERENNLWIFKGPNIKKSLQKQFYDERSEPFSPTYVRLALLSAILSLVLFIFTVTWAKDKYWIKK